MARKNSKNYTLTELQERQLQRWFKELNAVGITAGIAGISAAYYGFTSGPKALRIAVMFVSLVGAAWRAKRFLPPFRKKFQEKDPDKWQWVVHEKLGWRMVFRNAPMYPLSYLTFVAGLIANDTMIRDLLTSED